MCDWLIDNLVFNEEYGEWEVSIPNGQLFIDGVECTVIYFQGRADIVFHDLGGWLPTKDYDEGDWAVTIKSIFLYDATYPKGTIMVHDDN